MGRQGRRAGREEGQLSVECSGKASEVPEQMGGRCSEKDHSRKREEQVHRPRGGRAEGAWNPGAAGRRVQPRRRAGRAERERGRSGPGLGALLVTEGPAGRCEDSGAAVLRRHSRGPGRGGCGSADRWASGGSWARSHGGAGAASLRTGSEV